MFFGIELRAFLGCLLRYFVPVGQPFDVFLGFHVHGAHVLPVRFEFLGGLGLFLGFTQSLGGLLARRPLRQCGGVLVPGFEVALFGLGVRIRRGGGGFLLCGLGALQLPEHLFESLRPALRFPELAHEAALATGETSVLPVVFDGFRGLGSAIARLGGNGRDGRLYRLAVARGLLFRVGVLDVLGCVEIGHKSGVLRSLLFLGLLRLRWLRGLRFRCLHGGGVLLVGGLHGYFVGHVGDVLEQRSVEIRLSVIAVL